MAMKSPYRQASTIVTLPAPTGGWNARDAISAMQPSDAITLDNYTPGTGGIRSRSGFSVHAHSLRNYVETLMEYNSPGSEKLFAVATDGNSANIYDVTNAGTASIAVTSASNARWQHVMLANAAGHHLLAVNGANGYFTYSGSSWTNNSANVVAASAGTTPTASNFSNITVHAERVWFVRDQSLDSFYLNAASITGTATKFSIGSFCRRGGYLVAMGSWTRDGGNGPDDLLAFVTSKGEVVLYSGTDPTSVTTWNRVGTFNIPNPVGPRCLLKVGGELAVLTSKGLLPLSQVMAAAITSQGEAAYTDKIREAFKGAVEASKADNFGSYDHGWQCIEYPKRGVLIVNYPVTLRQTQRQFVMNVETGGWGRWLNMDAGCWGLLGDRIYWGGNNGKVNVYDTADVDNASASIITRVVLAYTDCGTPGLQKRFVMARPLIRLGTLADIPTVSIQVDYDVDAVELPAPMTAAGFSAWDTSTWDVSFWGDNSVPRLEWQTINGEGTVVSVNMVANASTQMELNTTDIMFETGGPF